MDELLKKLLEGDILTEETKKELEDAFKAKLDEAVEAAKTDAAADVRTELTEQWVQEREALIEAVDSKVGEFLHNELSELREDIDRFRDLETEHAEKLVEEKAQMKNELKSDLTELVEKIDAFLEIRLAAELEELKEDIDANKNKDFGRRIFEAFVDEYTQSYADDDSVEGTLRETEERLADTQKSLEESEEKLNRLVREKKLTEVLSPLTGRQRDVMEAILKNVATEQLEEGYKTFIGRVVREADKAVNEEDASEKEDAVLAEDTSEKEGKEKLDEKEGKVVSGDDEELLAEQKKTAADDRKLSEEARLRLQRLAGM